MICKPNGGILNKTIIEALEEISFAKDIGVIGNHDGSFTKGSAMDSDWVLFFAKIFLWEGHF
jgi:hypothetical protein